MAKCSKCGTSILFKSLTDGICDKCVISTLQQNLHSLHEQCKQLNSRLSSSTVALNAANDEIDRLRAERHEVLLERKQLICAGRKHAFISRYPEPAMNSDFYSPDGREFQRRITESLAYASSEAEHSAILDRKIERLQQCIELFDLSREACVQRGADFVHWFDETYNSQHDYRKRLCEMLNECIVLKNVETGGGVTPFDNLCDIIINIIRDEDGILQRELGQRFDPNLRSQVRHLLQRLERVGAITREKSGSTYSLHLQYNGVSYSILTCEPRGEIQDKLKFCHFCSLLRPAYENGVCSVCRHSIW